MSAEVKGKPQLNSLNRIYSVPAVNGAVGLFLSAYFYVKAFNPLVTKGLNLAESVATTNLKTASNLFEPQITALDNFACSGLDTAEKYVPTIQSLLPVVYATKLWDLLIQIKNQFPFNKFDQEENVSLIGKWLLFAEHALLSAICLANQAVDTYLVGNKKDLSVDSDDESDDEDNVKPNVIRELKKLTTKIQRALYQKASVKFQQLQRAIL